MRRRAGSGDGSDGYCTLRLGSGRGIGGHGERSLGGCPGPEADTSVGFNPGERKHLPFAPASLVGAGGKRESLETGKKEVNDLEESLNGGWGSNRNLFSF